MKNLKIAIVHDDFIQNGGAEFFIFDIAKELQKNQQFKITVVSSIVTSDWENKFKELNIEVIESFLGKLPFVRYYSKVLFLTPLFYISFESFDFTEYDFVISSSTRYGHSVITKPETIHISYINSPGKMMWETKKYFYGKKFLYQIFKNFLPLNRLYDYYSQHRSDYLIANSKNISSKIRKNYKLESQVLYPFINFEKIKKSNLPKKDYFILISRLIPWKRIDFVIEAFNELKLPLVIVGSGDDSYIEKLKEKAKDNITFVGFVSDSRKYQLLEEAKGLIFPQDEDFGLTMIESLYLNTPVIYFNNGGAKEILKEIYGIPFNYQDKNSLIEALNSYSERDFGDLMGYALNFRKEVFIEAISKFLNKQQV
jgi:glycosyltransferase involved in cell wall biosynthesis